MTEHKTEPMLHIHAPRGYYVGQVRAAGYRIWTSVPGGWKTPETAMRAAMRRMKGMKRARVLFCDTSGYYEPNLSMEAHRV